MNAPDFIIDRSQRTPGGALPATAIQQIQRTLMNGGCVVVPSDTCYSLGMRAARNAHDRINTILNRPKNPISLAFHSVLAIEQVVELDDVSYALLQRFTPGPLTVVCAAREAFAKDAPEFLTSTISSPLGTVGVRIPDSWIERDVAACIPQPLTTVAVRENGDGKEVRHFDRAVELVAKGISGVGRLPWGAVEGDVEGDGFYSHHSTVVEALPDGPTRLRVFREGDIPVEVLEAAAQLVPRGPRAL